MKKEVESDEDDEVPSSLQHNYQPKVFVKPEVKELEEPSSLESLSLQTSSVEAFETKPQESSKVTKKTYVCKSCDEVFIDRKSYLIHFSDEHLSSKFMCSKCGKKFPSNSKLQRHIKSMESGHKDDDAIDCPGCGVKFSNGKVMQEHFEKVHRVESEGVSCQMCDKIFTKQDHLKAHFFAFHTDKTFQCEKCDRVFNYKSAFERHKKVVHDKNLEHKCEVCNKGFGGKYDLALHFSTNHDNSKIADRTCKTCGKTFAKTKNLRAHIQAIHNESSFECEICGKKFSFKSAKERHVKGEN